MSTVTAQKWGNSLGIRIPKDAADRLGIEQGSEIELSLLSSENMLTLKPKKSRMKYTLEQLVSEISPDNRHGEIEFGVQGHELI